MLSFIFNNTINHIFKIYNVKFWNSRNKRKLLKIKIVTDQLEYKTSYSNNCNSNIEETLRERKI